MRDVIIQTIIIIAAIIQIIAGSIYIFRVLFKGKARPRREKGKVTTLKTRKPPSTFFKYFKVTYIGLLAILFNIFILYYLFYLNTEALTTFQIIVFFIVYTTTSYWNIKEIIRRIKERKHDILDDNLL